jgi:hypothetical protein
VEFGANQHQMEMTPVCYVLRIKNKWVPKKALEGYTERRIPAGKPRK